MADGWLHPAGSDFPAASELTHTDTSPCTPGRARLSQGSHSGAPHLLSLAAPASRPRDVILPLIRAQGRLTEEGSQFLLAPGWVEADVSDSRSSEGPKTDDITPSSCPSSPQDPYQPHGEAALGRARRKREGKGEEAREQEGRQRLELEVGYFGRKTKFCKTSPARLQKGGKTGGSVLAGPVIKASLISRWG